MTWGSVVKRAESSGRAGGAAVQPTAGLAVITSPTLQPGGDEVRRGECERDAGRFPQNASLIHLSYETSAIPSKLNM